MLSKGNTGLIVVDVQGKLATLMHESDALIENITKLVKGAKALDLPILWLEQNPERLGPTAEPIREVLESTHLPITKYTFDGCKEATFNVAVENAKVDTWLVCGIESHICVYQTAVSLRQSGYRVELVTDCVSSRTAANKALALAKLTANGVVLTGLEMCLYEIVEDCRAPEFKEILALIK
ncbi:MULTISPECIES: isochorismatase family protein [Vibrio harveyi group]|uniref:isochorismatase family protein n=1 Tax=Vibrio harveyi group TaxID=717610 RepID=UPI0015DD80B2|nr:MULTISPECIES: isochorismatase family protein [Vibrio harveyi group]EJG0911786.1 isochorismatase family protein [Vibrio parahaemolyticus]MBE3689275.1 isochorismatase family protein [Vibrio parahaemolyticus]MBE3805298.1 isochorismatase family protein [Vibrio parahaemolyticus]MBE4229533.1 isochorismatase family protein [Vibrio parahaemolyticus]MBE4483271.1 isochorismatase family protein [Vibrio parahaemolyticus]